MLLFLAFLVSLLAAAVKSAPSQTVPDRTGNLDWSSALQSYYSAVDSHITHLRDQPNFPNPPTCDLSKATLLTAPTPLPAVPAGQVLRHVAIGRGEQNYTCALASANFTPVAVGAVATLFNASCLAANYPDILNMLPNIALQSPIPVSAADTMSPANIDLSGHHFFLNTTTAFFNLSTTPQKQFGMIAAQKAAASSPPANATLGTGGVGDGSVPWLQLLGLSGDHTDDGLKTIYRVNTAGGNPPKTCESSPAAFSVQYAAEYWFYGNPL